MTQRRVSELRKVRAFPKHEGFGESPNEPGNSQPQFYNQGERNEQIQLLEIHGGCRRSGDGACRIHAHINCNKPTIVDAQFGPGR